MRVEIVAVGEFEVNCVLLWAEAAGQAWVVDPGADAEAIRDALRKHGLQVARYVCTHGHIDHISALDDLLKTDPAPVWMHADDVRWAFTRFNCLPPAYPHAVRRPAALCTEMQEGVPFDAAGIEARVLLTPGHSPGCICIHLPQEKLLLSGDTLFAGSVGRTDLPGSDGRRMRASLEKLLLLPDDTRVVCGHGPTTSIGEERTHNPHLQ